MQGDVLAAAAASWLGHHRSAAAGEPLKHADLGLHNDDEARAFAEQVQTYRIPVMALHIA